MIEQMKQMIEVMDQNIVKIRACLNKFETEERLSDNDWK